MLVRCEVCGKPLYIPSATDLRRVECGYCYSLQHMPETRETLSPAEFDLPSHLRRYAMATRPGEAALILLDRMQDDGCVTQRRDLCASAVERSREKAAALEPRVTAATTVEELDALHEELMGIPPCAEIEALRSHLIERTVELRAKRIRKARQVHLAAAVLVTLALAAWTLL